jgi:hypothetical protein
MVLNLASWRSIWTTRRSSRSMTWKARFSFGIQRDQAARAAFSLVQSC